MKPFPDHIDPSKITVGKTREADPDVLISSLCGRIWKRYMRGEPFAILEAHTMAVRNGYTPPAWVLERLSDVFSECLRTGGARSLDTMIGLKSPGKGKPPPIKARAKKLARHRRAFEIHRLVAHLNISPEDAAHMVLAREREGRRDTLKQYPDYIEARFRMLRKGTEGQDVADDAPSTAWLVEDYVRNYRHRWKSPEKLAEAGIGEPNFDLYPRDSWPKKALVKYLRAQYTSRSSI